MPRRPSADAAIRIKKDVVFRELEGEMVLLNLGTGVYFGLDAVGTRIWALIDGQRSAVDIVATLTEEYDVDPRTCAMDVERFLEDLRRNDLVDVDGGTPP
jgi:Coenzyme PQQ synthesis protein D (PqqD)